MTVLFVGDGSDNLFLSAQRYDPSTKLIDSDSISHLANISTGHISLCDLSSEEQFKYALEQADELYYVPISDTDATLKQKTESWLRYQSHRKPVHNLPNSKSLPILELVDLRKTKDPQLWVAGCSFTYGVGVNQQERWGDVLATMLKLPVSTLANPGSSIRWAADQILRSDIQAHDIVVWGVTGLNRFPYYDREIHHVCQTYYKNNPNFNSLINQRLLVTDHLLYESIISIEQVIRYCRLIGCKLVLTHFYLDLYNHESAIIEYLTKFDFYVDFGDSKLDYGADGDHPGPKQHRIYAETVYEFLTN